MNEKDKVMEQNVPVFQSEISKNGGETDVPNKMEQNGTPESSPEQFGAVISMIQKAFNLERPRDALPYFILWRHGRLSITKLKELMGRLCKNFTFSREVRENE